MLMRRYLTTPLNFNNVGQDSVVFSLYFAANNAAMSSGASLYPGSYLPFNYRGIDPGPGPPEPGRRSAGADSQLRRAE